MADFATDAIPELIVNENGFVAPDFNWGTAAGLSAVAEAGAWAAVDEGGATVGANALVLKTFEEAGPGLDWFERIHVLPRTKIDFGNIITTVTSTFELFNAYRRLPVVMTAFVNNAGTGVSIPNLPAIPFSVDPMSSVLDPSSVRLAPVKLSIVVTVDGPPIFDSSLDFFFDTGETPQVLVKGQRIVLVSFEPVLPCSEVLTFKSEVLGHVDGSEQVLALLKDPRQTWNYRYQLETTERQRMLAQIFDWQDNLFAVPVWTEQVRLTANASVAAVSVSVASTTDLDIRLGGMAVVWESSTKFDVVVISSITSTTVGFTTTPLTNSYTTSAFARLIPLRLAFMADSVGSERYPVNLDAYDIRFEVYDNHTGALTPSTSGFSTYNGKVLLDACNVMDRTKRQQFVRKVTIIDAETGQITQKSTWDKGKRVHEKGFTAHNRAAILALRRLLFSLRGQQVSFYIPTFIDDLTVAANLTLGASTIDITNIGYTRFIKSRAPKNVFKITFTDGTSLVRVVSSSIEVSTTVERLTLDTTWPANRTVAQISSVQFYELVRFATDQFEIQYPRLGLAQLFAPVKSLI